MCKAFSCIIHKSKKVYWKRGIDSHNDIFKKFKLDLSNEKRQYCQIEITPDNNNYVFPDKWSLHFDDGCPDWWKQSHESACFSALEKWKNYTNKLRN